MFYCCLLTQFQYIYSLRKWEEISPLFLRFLVFPFPLQSSPPTHSSTALRILQGPENRDLKNRLYRGQHTQMDGIPQDKNPGIELEKYPRWHRKDIYSCFKLCSSKCLGSYFSWNNVQIHFIFFREFIYSFETERMSEEGEGKGEEKSHSLLSWGSILGFNSRTWRS